MKAKHRNTIKCIKDYIKQTNNYSISPEKRFFEEEIKKKQKGSYGYTPDLVIRRTEDNAVIIVEVEYGVSPAKVIEDIILSNIIEGITLLVIITCYKDYVERWINLLKNNYPSLEKLKINVIECASETNDEYKRVVDKFKRYLNQI